MSHEWLSSKKGILLQWQVPCLLFNASQTKKENPVSQVAARGSRKFPIIKNYLEISSSEHKESDIFTEYSAIPLKESRIFR